MNVKITPSTCHGSITIPPSKSMAHRAIICASLAKQKSIIRNVQYSDDIKTTIAAMQSFGAKITCFNDSIEITGNPTLHTNTDALYVFCKESGSTLRFLIPLFSLLNKQVIFRGENRLLKRPQQIYNDMFQKQNLYFFQDEERIELHQSLKAGTYNIQGDVSSQFISGLLFALPLLEKDSTIHIQPPFSSKSYVNLTIQMLKRFSVHVHFINDTSIFIKGKQRYLANNYQVEADYSQAAFYGVLASINHPLTIKGLSTKSLQGDREIFSILKKFHVPIHYENQQIIVEKTELHPATIDLQDCPDLGPILTILMMFTKGKSKIINALRLRYKESDRISAMETELQKCKVDISSSEGSIVIHGAKTYQANTSLYGHKDHRIVMSLCIAATMLQTPTIIKGAEAIQKSYPDFFKDLKSIGIQIDIL
ncbi:MAG: 3-phosphoshikimate 1-carboxyvinyltransferase [Breznakia sp.]